MTVELHGGDRVLTTRSDRLGRFGFDEVLPGPVRLTILGARASRSSTPSGCCSDLTSEVFRPRGAEPSACRDDLG